MGIMAVMAHPDDAEIWCGGTLLLHVEKGDTVRICVLSYSEHSPRGRCAREGADRMGCELEMLGMEDTAIRETDDAVNRICSSFQRFQPDLVITHWVDDIHPDHEAVFQIIRRGLVRAHITRIFGIGYSSKPVDYRSINHDGAKKVAEMILAILHERS